MRALRILLIFVVIFGGLFIAADRAAVWFAEGKVADRIKSSQGLDADPKVSIKGFPFLTQVVGSKLDEVDVSVDGITAAAGGQSVQVTEVKAELKDVSISSSFSSATAAVANGSARISYADLVKSAPAGVTIGYAGTERAAKGQIKVSGQVLEVLEGAKIDIPDEVAKVLKGQALSTYSTVSVVGGNTIRLRTDKLPDLPVPGLNDQVKKLIDYDLKLDGLPTSIELSKVAASTDGLQFSGSGTDVALTG
jgi:hypothetical protein